MGCTVTSAPVDEREASLDHAARMNGFLLGDKGYLNSAFSHLLRDDYGVNLWTPQRRNMAPSCDPEADRVCFRIRRRVETVIGQLAERFHCEKIRARTLLSLER